MKSPQRMLVRAAALCAAVLLSFPSFAAEPKRNLAVAKTTPAANEVRVALVIGNSSYKDSPLANPVNDATDIAKALQQAGFKVILKRNVGARDMRQAIRKFGTELRRAQVGLFYFAGHGIQVKGANYLVPVGADIQSEADTEDLAIDANYALRTMEEAQVKVSIVILDACRNNPYARSFRSSARGLAQMSAATGSVIAYATAPGSVAADGQGRNGVYTKHLLASLAQSNTDILKVFQRTRAEVVKETGGKQTPWESISLVGDFHFRPGAAAMPGTGTGTTSAPLAMLQPDPAAFELAFWDSVKASANPEDYRAYLERFPNGQFASLARNRLAPKPEPAPPPPLQLAASRPCPGGFVGTWSSSYGTMILQADGRKISGTYDVGRIHGELDGTTLKGEWIETDSPFGLFNGHGPLTFTLSDDGRSFSGYWTRSAGAGNSNGTWSGTCSQ